MIRLKLINFFISFFFLHLNISCEKHTEHFNFLLDFEGEEYELTRHFSWKK
jgi:hypothetical protein